MCADGIVGCADMSQDLPRNADIEYLFDVEDCLQLYNWAFDANVAEAQLQHTTEPLLRWLEVALGTFDHVLPAHALTEHRDVFFSTLSPKTVERFTKLFELFNATVAHRTSDAACSDVSTTALRRSCPHIGARRVPARDVLELGVKGLRLTRDNAVENMTIRVPA